MLTSKRAPGQRGSGGANLLDPFDENAPEYFPSACCEFLHVQSALYLACFIQFAFVFALTLLYLLLEQTQFINAVDVFRPGVGFVVCVNVAGIVCALIGVCMQRDRLISLQITLLLGLVCLSDLVAFTLVATMAFGSRITLGTQLDARFLVQSLLVNDRRWESILGPFWPYLLAILFHMSACAMICFVSVYRRYGQYLKHKYAVVNCNVAEPPTTTTGMAQPPTAITTTRAFVAGAEGQQANQQQRTTTTAGMARS